MTKLPPKHFSYTTENSRHHRLRYVENKGVNPFIVQDLLSLSAEANQWTNFGPVCTKLEAVLTQQLALSDDLQVIACSNATVALHTLVAMHQYLQARPLRWVTSAFGFYSSCDGVLQSAEMVDCNGDGMLDLSLLDPSTFDGMVVTNLFGHYRFLDVYQQYATQHGKILLIDGAMAFHAGDHIANTCISMHHTKPWGFGEGGCAIVAKEHAELFRDMLAFGHQSPDSKINRMAINGKISDIACAYLLMRLEELDRFRESYQQQFLRIAAIGTGLGLSVLGNIDVHPGVPANVPFLFPRAIELESDPEVPARKYYHPLSDDTVAVDIYNRIINIACHSEMIQLDDSEIKNFLSALLARC